MADLNGIQKHPIKKRKKAVVDIDNTLWHFCDALYQELQIVNKDFPAPKTWTEWDLWEGYCSEDDFLKAVNAVHLNQHSEQYLPYPEAEDFLIALKEHHYHITIASHRSPDYRRQTETWLKNNRLVYDELHLSFNKTRLFAAAPDLVVDDSPQVLEKAAEYGLRATGLLFPWNQAYANNGYTLFNNLNEILVYVLQGEPETL